jgi:tetratricopeptide (TPR) repeat protein
LDQARYLLDRGQTVDARNILNQALAAGQDGAPLRSLLGLVLHQLGDLPGCERELRRAVELAPGDGAASFALASICNRLGKDAEAEAAVRSAIALGMDDVHSHLLLGRILNRQNRFTEAEMAWRAAIKRDPASPQGHRELAELVWMQSGDLAKARAALDAAPRTAEIVTITVNLLQGAGEERAGYELAAGAAARDPSLHILAARAVLGIDPQAADRHLAAAPAGATPAARAKTEIEVDLALGRAQQAVRRAEALQAARPRDQHATALLAAAWRLAGDPRYRALYDYDRLVGTYRIDPPEGWASLDAYLDDLGRALDALHGPLTHPVGQSLRHGSQTTRNLADYTTGPIRALFGALDAPIRRHIAAIGAPGQNYAILSAWSVRLNMGGFHINHVHPEGWISSAFYVRVPKDLQGSEGFLKFGEPGPPTAPHLPPEHLVKPEPGLLVLFPSYMWHGTVPFTSSDKRLSCAFDIVRRA